MIDLVPYRLSTIGLGAFGPLDQHKLQDWLAKKYDLFGFDALLDVRDMIDGANPLEVYIDRIAVGVELIRTGHYLLVACAFGRSRSNAIAAGILTAGFSMQIDEALNLLAAKGARINRAHVEALRHIFS